MSVPLDESSSTNQNIQRWLAETDRASTRKPDADAVRRPKTRTREDRRNNPSDRIDHVSLTTLTRSVDARKELSDFENGRIRRNTATTPRRARQTSCGSSHPRHSTIWEPHEDVARRHKEKSNARPNDREIKEPEEIPVVVDPSTKYAKRARHKAKPDKYEYKGEDRAVKNRRNHRKRKRSGSIGKEDFHAENIDTERVTLRPSGEQFVFSRSKMSMPLAGHDLPDLTFTKMDFLSRPRSSAHQESTQANNKQDRKSDNPRKSRKINVQQDTAVRHIQTRSTSTGPDSCSVETRQPNSRSVVVHSSRSRDGTTWTHPQVAGYSSWVRSKVDPRLEEYKPASTSEKHSTPVSWSTSPSPRDSTRAVSTPQQAVTVSSTQEQIKLTKQQFHIRTRSVSPRSSASNDICDGLAQRLLQKLVRPDEISSHRTGLNRYHSLEDLISMAGRISKLRSPDDLPRKDSIAHDNRPHIGLRGWADAYIAHGPASLYIDDMGQQQKYQTSLPRQSVGRLQLAQERYEPALDDSKDLFFDRRTADKPCRKPYKMPHTDTIETVRSPAKIRRSDWQLILAPQQSSCSPIQYKPIEVRQDRFMDVDDTTPFGRNELQELDEFDLELLETAKMGVSQQASLQVADLRHPNQESSAWPSQCNRSAIFVSRTSQPSMSCTTERLHESYSLRTRDENQIQMEKPNLTPERSTLQNQIGRPEFNPFRDSWLFFE